MEKGSSSLSEKLQNLELLWNPEDVVGSERAYLILLPIAKQLVGDERTYLVDLYIQLAHAQIIQKKIADAKLSLEEAEKIFNDSTLNLPVTIKIKWLLERGRFFILDRTPSQARNAFVEAWGLAESENQEHTLVEISQLMAIIEPQKSQQEWIKKAIQIAEKSYQEKAKELLGSLYMSLGWKLYDLKQFEKCIDKFQEAFQHFSKYGTEREKFLARWSIGKALRLMNKSQEAYEIQKTLLSESGALEFKDGRLYEELAECLQALNRSAEAQPFFELAYKELSSNVWVTDNQPVQLKRMKDLGKVKEKN